MEREEKGKNEREALRRALELSEQKGELTNTAAMIMLKIAARTVSKKIEQPDRQDIVGEFSVRLSEHWTKVAAAENPVAYCIQIVNQCISKHYSMNNGPESRRAKLVESMKSADMPKQWFLRPGIIGKAGQTKRQSKRKQIAKELRLLLDIGFHKTKLAAVLGCSERTVTRYTKGVNHA